MRKVLTFYKFTTVADPTAVREVLLERGESLGIKGTLLIAEEGLNGTIVGEAGALRSYAAGMEQEFGRIPYKWSDLDQANPGFYRFKVKLKKEIVTLGIEGLDPLQTGQHVSPEEWNQLLDDPDVVVIDTRNTYEIDIGTFPGSVSPETTNFREFPGWVAQNLDPAENRRVAMFCTGGIRCEKAAAYMLSEGFENVYQLNGGVLSYLEHVEPEQNKWQGECFVFDQRVSVNADLTQGDYQQCFACRHPVSADDMRSELYEAGVSCPHCHARDDTARRASLRERQKQVALAEERGEQHIGARQG